MESRKTLIERSSPSFLKDGSDREVTLRTRCRPEVAYLELSELDHALEANKGHVLAVLYYGGDAPITQSLAHPAIQIDLAQFNSPPLAEVWTSQVPVTYQSDDQISAAMNDEVVFGRIEVEEPGGSCLDELTYAAYSRILGYTQQLRYQHLLRIWNHFPAINREQQGVERYRRFCVGRHRAFSEYGSNFKRLLPAGTAVGTNSGPLQIYFLAGTHEGRHIENPRQVSAYEYPAIYGPRSPAFARATLEPLPEPQRLFIAGTSSIVGHSTEHAGDPTAQTLETLRNLQTLIQHVRAGGSSTSSETLRHALLKVYVRHDQDIPLVKEIIQQNTKEPRGVLYLQGDMCRKELLVEIETVVPLIQAAGKPSP